MRNAFIDPNDPLFDNGVDSFTTTRDGRPS
jgi:hypothetical protein